MCHIITVQRVVAHKIECKLIKQRCEYKAYSITCTDERTMATVYKLGNTKKVCVISHGLRLFLFLKETPITVIFIISLLHCINVIGIDCLLFEVR
jgi:hypothetical protein